jgi:hypothetical protein
MAPEQKPSENKKGALKRRVSRYPVSLGTIQRLRPFSNRRVPETIERSAIVGTELFLGLQVLPKLSSQHFSTDGQFRLRTF